MRPSRATKPRRAHLVQKSCSTYYRVAAGTGHAARGIRTGAAGGSAARATADGGSRRLHGRGRAAARSRIYAFTCSGIRRCTRDAALADIRRYRALALACPFLVDEACGVYAERPFVCRRYLVTSPRSFARPRSTMRCRGSRRRRRSRPQCCRHRAVRRARPNAVPLILALGCAREHRDTLERTCEARPRRPGDAGPATLEHVRRSGCRFAAENATNARNLERFQFLPIGMRSRSLAALDQRVARLRQRESHARSARIRMHGLGRTLVSLSDLRHEQGAAERPPEQATVMYLGRRQGAGRVPEARCAERVPDVATHQGSGARRPRAPVPHLSATPRAARQRLRRRVRQPRLFAAHVSATSRTACAWSSVAADQAAQRRASLLTRTSMEAHVQRRADPWRSFDIQILGDLHRFALSAQAHLAKHHTCPPSRMVGTARLTLTTRLLRLPAPVSLCRSAKPQGDPVSTGPTSPRDSPPRSASGNRRGGKASGPMMWSASRRRTARCREFRIKKPFTPRRVVSCRSRSTASRPTVPM